MELTDQIASKPNNPQESDTLCEKGASAYRDDRFGEAIEYFNEALQIDPGHVRSLVYRGIIAHGNKEYDQACLDFDEAIRQEPTSDWAHLWRGAARLAQGRIPEALADYSESIRLDPDDSNAYYNRGVAYQRDEQFEAAIADYSRCLELGGSKARVLKRRAECYEEIGDDDLAEADDEAARQLKSQNGESMVEQDTQIINLLQKHFGTTSADSLTITERRFPGRVRADLQRAIDALFEQMHVCHFCGVRKQYSHDGVDFGDLLVRNRNDPPLSVPPQYEEIDIGEADPLRCLKHGLWLLEEDGNKFAVFLEPGGDFQYRAFGHTGVRFQVATANSEAGTRITQKFFKHLERSVQEARSYRGKILSLEASAHGFTGTSSGIAVHKLRTVERDQVILPRRTLELLERNVIQFVQQRPQLAKLGLSTRKGLLFYGPPGVGKTHTLHYLAGALEGMTTLLISAEQVGLLAEYMTLARLLQPSMVVIEDADLIARDREQMSGGCEEVMLNKLLNEMDGLKEDADILFILTTNRPESLEAALASRPGRIDQSIEFPLPDDDGRRILVRLYSRGLDVPDNVVENTVKRTANVSAAFIKELMRRAAQFQIERNGTGALTEDDVNNALEELLFTGGSLNRKFLGGNVESE